MLEVEVKLPSKEQGFFAVDTHARNWQRSEGTTSFGVLNGIVCGTHACLEEVRRTSVPLVFAAPPTNTYSIGKKTSIKITLKPDGIFCFPKVVGSLGSSP